jgi:hypothetical protein
MPKPQLSTTIIHANANLIILKNPIPVQTMVLMPSDLICLQIHIHSQGVAQPCRKKDNQPSTGQNHASTDGAPEVHGVPPLDRWAAWITKHNNFRVTSPRGAMPFVCCDCHWRHCHATRAASQVKNTINVNLISTQCNAMQRRRECNSGWNGCLIAPSNCRHIPLWHLFKSRQHGLVVIRCF